MGEPNRKSKKLDLALWTAEYAVIHPYCATGQITGQNNT